MLDGYFANCTHLDVIVNLIQSFLSLLMPDRALILVLKDDMLMHLQRIYLHSPVLDCLPHQIIDYSGTCQNFILSQDLVRQHFPSLSIFNR